MLMEKPVYLNVLGLSILIPAKLTPVWELILLVPLSHFNPFLNVQWSKAVL